MFFAALARLGAIDGPHLPAWVLPVVLFLGFLSLWAILTVIRVVIHDHSVRFFFHLLLYQINAAPGYWGGLPEIKGPHRNPVMSWEELKPYYYRLRALATRS